MVASVFLLATSQYFWLRSEYKEHRRAFYSNADLLFKETVRTIEDSLASRTMTHSIFYVTEEKQEPPKKRVSIREERPGRELKVTSQPPLEKDTLIIKRGINLNALRTDSSGAVILSDSGVIHLILRSQQQADSLRHFKRLLTQLPRLGMSPGMSEADDSNRPSQPPRRRLVFASAPLDSVTGKYNQRINEMGYPVAFFIRKDSIPPDTSGQGFRRTMRSYSQMQKRLRNAKDSVVVNGVAVLNPESVSSFSIIPTVIFKAYPQDLNRYLLKKLRNNILFSVFILVVTSLTFWLIFRNLRKQSRLNALKNDLINNVTHELKTPLATLSVALEALQQFGGNTNPQTTRDYLEISQNEVNRLSLMVDNILKTSLLEKQGVTLYPTEVDLEKLGALAVKSWQPRFLQTGGHIHFTRTGDDFLIEADELQVSSVLNNLIDNALKYSGAAPQVEVEVRGEPRRVSLKVKDGGMGIPREYQSQVFDKFFRVPTGDRHNVKGYGLGLNYVKHIMDLHEGLVTLESGSNGTTFVLTFKRKL